MIIFISILLLFNLVYGQINMDDFEKVVCNCCKDASRVDNCDNPHDLIKNSEKGSCLYDVIWYVKEGPFKEHFNSTTNVISDISKERFEHVSTYTFLRLFEGLKLK